MAISKLIHYSDNSYITNQGTLLEGFETFSDWTIWSAADRGSADYIHKKQGIQSLRLNSVNAQVCHATKTISEDLSSVSHFIIWVYVDDDVDLANLSDTALYFSSTDDWSKDFHVINSVVHHKHGWNRFVFHKDAFTNEGGESWSNTMIRLRVRCKATTGNDISVSFDDLRYDHVAKAKCIIGFDDGAGNIYDNAKPRMDTNGQSGVAFMITDEIDESGYMTKAELTALQSAGWNISNHSKAHPHLINLSQVAMEDDIDGAYDWLVDNGFSVGAKFFAYPYGEYNQALITKIKERHRIARCSQYGWYQPHFPLLDNDQEFLVKTRIVKSGSAPATVQGWIDDAIIQKGLLVFMFHSIVLSGATGDYEYNKADFEAVSDYLKTKQDAGLIDVITFSDYYDQFMPSDLTSVVYLKRGAIVPFPIAHEPSESISRTDDGRLKVYSHPLAGDRKRVWRIKCIIDNSGSSGYKWRDLEYFYWKVVEGAKRRCVFVDANSVQYLVRIIGFAPKATGLNNRHEVTMILEEDYT